MKKFIPLLCILVIAAIWWGFRSNQSTPASVTTPPPPPATAAVSVEPVPASKSPSPSSAEAVLPAAASIATSIPVAIPGQIAFPEVLAWVASLPPSSNEAPIPAELLPVLKLRAQTLREWILTDPEAALQSAITPYEYGKLPSAARDFFEQALSGTGTFGVLAVCNHDDSADTHGSACEILHPVDLNGESFTASIYGTRANRQTEDSASLYGIAMGDALALHQDDAVVLPASRISSDPSLASQFAVIHHGKPSFFANQTAANQYAATLNP